MLFRSVSQSRYSDKIFYYEFDSQLGEYIAHCNQPGSYLIYVPYTIGGEKVYVLWYWYNDSVDSVEILEEDFDHNMNGTLYHCDSGRNKQYYGIKLSGDPLPNCPTIVPYLENGVALPFSRANGVVYHSILCFSDHVLLPPEEND